MVLAFLPLAGSVVSPESAFAETAKPTVEVTRAATGKLTIKMGAKYKLAAKASSGKLSYKSSSPNRVSVTKKGVVKAKKTGKATITVTAKNGSKKTKKKVIVTVVKASKFKKVKMLTASISKTKLEVGEKTSIKVSFKPKKPSNKNIIFKSSNNGVAKVSPLGVVTANKAGTATITVTSCDNAKAKTTVKVTVKTAGNGGQSGAADEGQSAITDEDDAFDKLVDMVHSGKVDASLSDEGTVNSIYGEFTDQSITTASQAVKVLNDSAVLFGDEFLASVSDIDVREMSLSGEKTRYFRYTPTSNGLPVEGYQIILSASDNGAIEALTSSYSDAIHGVNTTATVTEGAAVEEALRCAEVDSGVGGFKSQDAKLLIARDMNGVASLLYRIDVEGSNGSGKTCYIYANDEVGTAGMCAFIADWDESDVELGGSAEPTRLAGGSLLGATTWTSVGYQAQDLLENMRTIVVEYDGASAYQMRDADRDVETYKVSYASGSSEASYPGNLVTFVEGGEEEEAVSVHANLEKVYDYYRNNLDRDSFDDKGAAVLASYGEEGYANACWSPGLQQFKFGRTQAKDYAAALDIVGHEFTHAVVNYVVGDGHGTTLTYSGESGALNESYADIMGTFIEQKPRSDSGYWLHGEDSRNVGRSLEDPGSIVWSDAWKQRFDMDSYPSHYTNRYTGSEDHGGVHVNSNIFNHAAYLMVSDERTSGVSDVQWAKVFYSSLSMLTSDADFEQGRNAVVSAAKSQGFTASQVLAIEEAFYAVGIGSAVNTEESLRAKLAESTSKRVLNFYFDDFDVDFDYEAFAVTYDEQDEFGGYAGVDVWYVDENGARLVESIIGGHTNGLVNSKNYKFLSFEQEAGGSGSKSYVYGSRNHAPCKMSFTGTATWKGSMRTYTWKDSNVMNFRDAEGDSAVATESLHVNESLEFADMTFVLDEPQFKFKLVGYDNV